MRDVVGTLKYPPWCHQSYGLVWKSLAQVTEISVSYLHFVRGIHMHIYQMACEILQHYF